MEEILVYKVILSHLHYKENVEAYLRGGPYPPLTAHTDHMHEAYVLSARIYALLLALAQGKG